MNRAARKSILQEYHISVGEHIGTMSRRNAVTGVTVAPYLRAGRNSKADNRLRPTRRCPAGWPGGLVAALPLVVRDDRLSPTAMLIDVMTGSCAAELISSKLLKMSSSGKEIKYSSTIDPLRRRRGRRQQPRAASTTADPATQARTMAGIDSVCATEYGAWA